MPTAFVAIIPGMVRPYSSEINVKTGFPGGSPRNFSAFSVVKHFLPQICPAAEWVAYRTDLSDSPIALFS